MKVLVTESQHEVAYSDLLELLQKRSETLTAVEMLAVAANMVGKLVALQDQRTMTPDIAMQVVAKNIEIGNKQAVFQMAAPKEHA
jgi:hypothetical protein